MLPLLVRTPVSRKSCFWQHLSCCPPSLSPNRVNLTAGSTSVCVGKGFQRVTIIDYLKLSSFVISKKRRWSESRLQFRHHGNHVKAIPDGSYLPHKVSPLMGSNAYLKMQGRGDNIPRWWEGGYPLCQCPICKGKSYNKSALARVMQRIIWWESLLRFVDCAPLIFKVALLRWQKFRVLCDAWTYQVHLSLHRSNWSLPLLNGVVWRHLNLHGGQDVFSSSSDSEEGGIVPEWVIK